MILRLLWLTLILLYTTYLIIAILTSRFARFVLALFGNLNLSIQLVFFALGECSIYRKAVCVFSWDSLTKWLDFWICLLCNVQECCCLCWVVFLWNQRMVDSMVVIWLICYPSSEWRDDFSACRIPAFFIWFFISSRISCPWLLILLWCFFRRGLVRWLI